MLEKVTPLSPLSLSDPSSDLSEATLGTRVQITRSGSPANLFCSSIKTPFRIVTTRHRARDNSLREERQKG